MSLTLFEILFIIVAFLTNIVQAVTGFAGTVLAMPPSIKLVGYDVARPVLNLAAIVICLIVAIVNFKSINIKKLLFIVAFMAVGFGIGYLIQRMNVNQTALLRAYGAVICMLSICFMLSETLINFKMPKWFYPFIIILAGILHFLYTSGGPLLIVFMAATVKDKNEFRATLSTVWIFLNSAIFGLNISEGLFTPHIFFIAGIIIVVSLLSVILGRIIAKKMNVITFRRFTYLLLFISGVLAVL